MRKRRSILILLILLSALTYLDRICIAVAGPRMQRELGISVSAWGWVLGIFLISYGALEIPMGALGDRIGHRRVLTRIVLWWSAFTALTGLVSSFPSLVITRFFFGAGEAGAYPNISGVIAGCFPASERARAQGLVWAASRLGGALAPLLIVSLQETYNWRTSFWLLALLGALWAAVWLTRSDAQLAEKSSATSVSAAHSIPWRALAGSRQIWLLMAMYWFYVWGSVFYLSWFHAYLTQGRGFAEREMARYAALPFIAGAVGNLAGGFWSDRLTRRFGRRIGRSSLGASCLAASALLLFAAARATGRFTSLCFLAVGFGLMDCMLPAAWAICLDIGHAYAGTVAAAMNFRGSVWRLHLLRRFRLPCRKHRKFQCALAADRGHGSSEFGALPCHRPQPSGSAHAATHAVPGGLKSSMKLGISSWTFPWSIGMPGREPPDGQRMNALDLLDWARRAGLSVVQLADNLPLHSVQEAAMLGEKAAGLAIEIELGTRGLDPENLHAYLCHAKALNCRLIRTLLPSPPQDSRPAIVTRLKELLPEFERARVTLAIENYEAQSSASLLELVTRFDNEFLRVCLDTTNCFGALETPDETVNMLAPVAVSLHIKDFAVERLPEKLGFLVTGRPAGQGRLNIPRVLDRIRSCSPGASVILEQWPAYAGSVEETVRMEREWAFQGINYLRSVLHEH